jgi:hypothetical protein
MKPAPVIIIILLFLCSLRIAFAQFGNETITITTYYPSPYGVYKNMRIYPSDEPTDESVKQSGTMYFDKNNDTLFIYSENQGKFLPVGASLSAPPGPGNYLVNAAHSEQDCVDAKGELIDTDVGLRQCRFGNVTDHVSVCPAGWTRYKLYGTIEPVDCRNLAGPVGCGAATCPVPGLAWGRVVLNSPCLPGCLNTCVESGVTCICNWQGMGCLVTCSVDLSQVGCY